METRTIKELLQVILDNENYFESGLCVMIGNLNDEDVISDNEYCLLDNYFDVNLPVKKYDAPWSRPESPIFSFKYDEWPPRKEWLEKQIESFKNI